MWHKQRTIHNSGITHFKHSTALVEPNIGWPVQTGRTIYNKLNSYPSPDILINPYTDRIHHYLYTIEHICGTNKEQFTIPAITHYKHSTALVERPRQTAQLPTCHRLARHYHGVNLQRHAVAQTTHIRHCGPQLQSVYPRHYNPQVQPYKRSDRCTCSTYDSAFPRVP